MRELAKEMFDGLVQLKDFINMGKYESEAKFFKWSIEDLVFKADRLMTKLEDESIVGGLEKRLGEFDYLFQEGVVFSIHERHKIKEYAHNILAICNDAFFKTTDDDRTPVQKQTEKLALNELVKQIKEDGLNSYQQEMLDKILSFTK